MVRAWFSKVIDDKYGDDADVDTRADRTVVEVIGGKAYFVTKVYVTPIKNGEGE